MTDVGKIVIGYTDGNFDPTFAAVKHVSDYTFYNEIHAGITDHCNA
jgi:hypothetical protein